MPHIVFNNSKKIVLPFESNDVKFLFIAKSYNLIKNEKEVEYKIGINYDNKDFLLTLKNKGENKIVKVDKVTRISPISLAKNSLKEYVKAINANILFSNINSFSQKIKPKKEYLKDIEYFINDFNIKKEIRIEIGFGSGRHLLYQAKNNLDVQFIGLEIHTPSIEQLLKQLKIQKIKNVLVVNYDARLFMEFINSNKVSKIFVHFPIPWDKKPHRRIYSDEFINEALRVLKPKGTLELRTDSKNFFNYCTQLLLNLNSGKIKIDINKDLPISSKYEDRWKKQNKNIYDLVIESQVEDKEIKFKYDFLFDEVKLDNLKDNINKPIICEDYFIHIKKIFLLEEINSGLIQVVFGSFDKPFSKFIYVKNGIANYYQGKPLPIDINIKCHKKLKEIFR